MRWTLALAVVLSGALAAVAHAAEPAGGDGVSAVQDVVKAWQERRARVRGVRVSWNERCEWTPPPGHPNLPNQARQGLLPAKPTAWESAYTLTWDLHQYRLQTDGFRDGGREMHLTETQNGLVAKTLLRSHRSFGGIRPATEAPEVFALGSQPLLHALVGFCPTRDLTTASNLQFRERTTTPEGRPCLVLTCEPRDSSQPYTYDIKVDPARDYAIIELVARVLKQPRLHWTVEVAEVPGIGWFPRNWRATIQHADGLPETTVTSELVSLELNPVFQAADFDIAFAEGVWVSDDIHESEYIVTPDNGRRPVREADRLSSIRDMEAARQ